MTDTGWEDVPSAWEDISPAAPKTAPTPVAGPPSLLSRIMAPIQRAGEITASEARAGMQEIGKGMEPVSAVDPGDHFSSARELASLLSGTAQVAGAPFIGLGKAVFGEPISKGLEAAGLPGWAARGVGKSAELGAEMVAPVPAAKLAAAGVNLAGKAISPVKGMVRSATGTAAEESAEALRETALNEAKYHRQATEREAAPYRARLEANQKALEMLSDQPAVAETRAQRAAITSAPFAAERERVLAGLRDRARAIENEYKGAGFDAKAAAQKVAEYEDQVAAAEMAVGRMEKQYLDRPTVDAETFGKDIRQTSQALYDKLVEKRTAESGFKEAVESAGPALRVDTAPLLAKIGKNLHDIRNPALRHVMETARDLLKTGNENGLSVQAADSLRGYLGAIRRTKQVGEQKIDAEALHFVGELEGGLTEATKAAWQPYREAMARWRSLSRPLDILERKGALKRVIDTDPVSTDYMITEAEVVGQVISKAKAGNPVFTRLLAERPELRPAARLYFSGDLFGKDTVPSEAVFRTWLKGNEQPLKQLGLYDEFKSMRDARGAAQRAVEEAKGVRAESAAVARKAAEREREIGARLKAAQSLRNKERARAEMEAGQMRTPVEMEAASARRAAASRARLEAGGKVAATEKARLESRADQMARFSVELDTAPARDVAQRTRSFLAKLREDKLIGDDEYGEMLRRVEDVAAQYGDTAEARKHLQHAIYWALLAGGIGGTTYHFIRGAM